MIWCQIYVGFVGQCLGKNKIVLHFSSNFRVFADRFTWQFAWQKPGDLRDGLSGTFVIQHLRGLLG